MSERGSMGIFEDYMGVQYREGISAFKDGLDKSNNPYVRESESGQAWRDGWDWAYFDRPLMD